MAYMPLDFAYEEEPVYSEDELEEIADRLYDDYEAGEESFNSITIKHRRAVNRRM